MESDEYHVFWDRDRMYEMLVDNTLRIYNVLIGESRRKFIEWKREGKGDSLLLIFCLEFCYFE
jgi:hypothetical protein